MIPALVTCSVYVALSKIKGKGATSLLISSKSGEKSYSQHKNTAVTLNPALLTASVKGARIDSVWRLNSYLCPGVNVRE